MAALSYLLSPESPLAPQLSTSHLNTELPKTSARDTPPRTDVKPHVSGCHTTSDSLPATRLMDFQKEKDTRRECSRPTCLARLLKSIDEANQLKSSDSHSSRRYD